MEGVTSSKLLAKHLNALHSARRAFIENESSEKLRRALRSKTRDITSRDFDIGDHVYYKRNGHNEWRGPGGIRAISGKTVLVQHGGFYNKVSPCALRLVNERDTYNRESYNDGLACGVDNVEPDNVEPYYGDEIEVDYNAIFDDQEFECDNGEQNVVEESDILEQQDDESEQSDGSYTDQESNIAEEEPEADVDENIQHLPSDDIENYPSERKEAPNVGQRVQFVDPDTGIIGDFTIVSRAGKSTGAYANWRNVHNVETDVLKSINFDSVQEWKYIDTEQTMSVQSDNNNEILVAKTQELENWKQFSVYEEVEDEGQNTISVRWVLSEKVKDGNISIKARLVARGFEEDTSEINKRSPTCAKEFLRLANCISVSNKWVISSLDVKAAFLQGYNIEREVYLPPPKEAGTDKL